MTPALTNEHHIVQCLASLRVWQIFAVLSNHAIVAAIGTRSLAVAFVVCDVISESFAGLYPVGVPGAPIAGIVT